MAHHAQRAIAVVIILASIASLGFQWTTTVVKKRAPILPPRSSTFYGVAWGITDSADVAGPGPQAVTPPANMKAGDLAMLFGVNRSVNVEINMGVAGGQTWDSAAPVWRSAANSGQFYWCEFNGTWSANPSLRSASGTTGLIVGMAVFRPADSSLHVWSFDGTADTARYGSAARFTIATKTASVDSTISVAIFHSGDDNAWKPYVGNDWTDGTASLGIKNISGSDLSIDWVYKIQAAAGASGACADTLSARGNDAAGSFRAIFK